MRSEPLLGPNVHLNNVWCNGVGNLLSICQLFMFCSFPCHL
jgi:hypothetical protein